MTRKRLWGTGALLTVALMSATPASAAAPPAGPDPKDRPESAMIGAMRRDLDLTPGQVADRLADEGEARRREARLRATLQDAYAGSWVTDAGTLVVATTDRATVRTITTAGARATLADRSLADLTAIKNVLDTAAGRKPPAGVSLWYVDNTTNRVVIEAATADAARAFRDAAGVDPAAVRVKVTTRGPIRLTAPIPGEEIRGIARLNETLTGVDQARCTAGFAVRLGNAPGFITAGHCFENSDRVFDQNGDEIGIVEARSFPGDDYAFVVLRRGESIRGAVQTYGDGVVPVRGAAPAPVGSAVCRAGFVSQLRCGTILARNVTATAETDDGGSVVISGLTSTDACAERGDSGGPFLAGDQAQGILSAKTGDCSSRSPVSMFQPIDEPLTRHGLTLITE